MKRMVVLIGNYGSGKTEIAINLAVNAAAEGLRTLVIDLDKVKMKGYGFQIEMKYSTYKLGFKIQEVPIIFVDRTEGTSKMSSGIFGEAFWGVMKLKMRKIRPRK